MSTMNGTESALLGDLLEPVQRALRPEPGKLYVEIGIRSHGRGIFCKPKVLGVALGSKRVFEVIPDCLTLNIVFAWEGAVAVTTQEHSGLIASHRFPMYRVDSKRALLPFVNFFLRSDAGLRILRLASPGGAGRNRTLNQRQFLSARIRLPSIQQQQIICSLLSSYDTNIGQLDELLSAKRRFKSVVTRQLLLGERRFPEFSECAWETATLGTFLKESQVPSSNGSTQRRLTIRLHGKGVVPSENRRKGSDATKYYRRSAGQFIYSKLDFLNGACGVIPSELDGYDTTSDLPAFDVSSKVDARWLAALVSQPWFYRRYVGLTAGGRKAKRMNTREFLRIETAVPGLDEQLSTTALLHSMEREIVNLEGMRDLIDQERRSVAELLLTEKVGVPA